VIGIHRCCVGRYLVATLQQHAGPLLETLAGKLIACFQHRTHSCFLYLGATLVTIFGGANNAAHQKVLHDMLVHMVGAVCGQVLGGEWLSGFREETGI
jgi:hypothetical protein